MSDEEENHEHQFHVFPFQLGPTPEQIERAKMDHEASAHETRQFFDSLDVDQLRKLSGLLAMCYSSDGDAALQFMGIISGFLDQKFKICMACGKNHDEELQSFSPPRFSVAEQVKLMEEYRVYNRDGRLECKDCGNPIASLEDRMLRKPGPEGCSGCIEREKWG